MVDIVRNAYIFSFKRAAPLSITYITEIQSIFGTSSHDTTNTPERRQESKSILTLGIKRPTRGQKPASTNPTLTKGQSLSHTRGIKPTSNKTK
jgi:hypothetical protein